MKQRPGGSFMKELKLLDPRLDCYLEEELAKKRGITPLYVITYDRPFRGPIIIHVIHDGNFGYKEPDKRDLDFLAEGDCEKQSLKSQLDAKCRYFEEVRKKKEMDFEDNIHHLTRENKTQLLKLYNNSHGSGKGAHHVRKVEPKNDKGYRVVDNRKIK